MTTSKSKLIYDIDNILNIIINIIANKISSLGKEAKRIWKLPCERIAKDDWFRAETNQIFGDILSWGL